MKKSVTKNYIYNLIYQILILIIPIFTTPYVSRILGAENIGIYSYTLSITTYFILFGSLGIAYYGQREIAYLQNKEKEYSKVFWEIIILRFITMIISMIIFYYVFVNSKQYSIYYKILLLELLANCFDISWFLQGLEEFKKTVFRNIIVKLISVILIFTFVKTSNDLNIYILIYALSTLIGNISLWAYLPKYLKKIKFSNLEIIKHFKSTIGLFIPQIAIQIYTVLDKVMIGSIIIDKSEVGYYEQSQKIVKMLLTVITSLGTVMIPRMANTFINGDTQKMKEYMKKAFNFVFILAFPMIFGIINVGKWFVPIFFGQGYEKVIILMNIISPILLLIGLSNVIGTQYLLPSKRQKEFTFSVIVGAIINFLVNILLIKKYGAIGASIGTVIAEAMVTAIQFYIIRKEVKIFEIIRIGKNYFLATLVMFIINIFVANYILINVNGIINIGIQIITGGIVYIVMLLVLKDKFIYQIINMLKQKYMSNKI